MKRFDKKIGEKTENLSEERVARVRIRKVIAVLLMLSLAGCEKPWHGSEGRPGDAYLSLHWQVAEPDYIDAGTGSIPSVFYWGEFYKIRPGYYNLYYEGAVWTGMAWAFYAWEVSYEIWEIQGEQGDWYYNGANGPDNFFTIVCSPYGPAVNNSYKSGREMSYEVLSETDSEIIIKQKAEGFEMRITYKKSDPIKTNKTEQSIK